jgi:hypothetical protein
VKIGDGCATVTDYKLPLATVPLEESGGGKAGARLRPKSGYRSGCARRDPAKRDQLLRQEKDEASLLRECEAGSLNAFILRFVGMKVFLLSRHSCRCIQDIFFPALVLPMVNPSAQVGGH